MASISGRLARAASAVIPGSTACKGMIVLSSVKHLVRHFHFERTPNARTFYVWSSVVPLFAPMKNITLNYGHRLSLQRELQDYLKVPEDIPPFGKSLGELLAEKHVPSLAAVDSVEAFLHRFPFDETSRNTYENLDYGIAYCLVDRVETGVRLLEIASSTPHTNPFAISAKLFAQQRLADLKQGKAVFLKAIEACEQENLRLHFPGVY
jgi:hypothetical protein